jgi:hypothetical protein
MCRDDFQVGAKLHRPGHGHGRANAELACRIRAGGDNAAAFRAAPHGEGLAAQAGVALLFHRAEESIEVEMDDGALFG